MVRNKLKPYTLRHHITICVGSVVGALSKTTRNPKILKQEESLKKQLGHDICFKQANNNYLNVPPEEIEYENNEEKP